MTPLGGETSSGAGAHWRKFVIAFYVAIATAVVTIGWIRAALEYPGTAWDFPVFYIAAHLPPHSLYSRMAFATFWQEQLAPLGVRHWAPYVRLSIFPAASPS